MSTYTVKTIRMAPYFVACSMQHVSTVSTYPGSCKTCFSRIPVFGGNFLLIFPIIYQIAHLHNWPTMTWSSTLFTLCRHLPWMGFPACMYRQCQHTPDFQSIWPVRYLNFTPMSKCNMFWLYQLNQHWNYLQGILSRSFTKVSLLADCAWGTQGLYNSLDWSDSGQVWAIRFRRVWVS